MVEAIIHLHAKIQVSVTSFFPFLQAPLFPAQKRLDRRHFSFQETLPFARVLQDHFDSTVYIRFYVLWLMVLYSMTARTDAVAVFLSLVTCPWAVQVFLLTERGLCSENLRNRDKESSVLTNPCERTKTGTMLYLE